MIDISEIKKLPVQEKLRIIDELWESIDADSSANENEVNEEETVYGIDEAEESAEVASLLEERWKDIKDGKVKTVAAEEAEKELFQFIAGSKKT